MNNEEAHRDSCDHRLLGPVCRCVAAARHKGGTTRPNTNARRSCPESGCCGNGRKENTETPQAEPDEELGAVPVPAPAEPMPAVETPQPEPAPPTPQPTIELQPGDEVYIPGFGWVPYEGGSPRVCRGYVRKWQQNRHHGLKQDLLGAVMLLAYESCCTEKWLVSYYDTNHFLPMWN